MVCDLKKVRETLFDIFCFWVLKVKCCLCQMKSSNLIRKKGIILVLTHQTSMEKDERMFKFAKVEEGLGFDENRFDISFVFNQNGLRGL